MAKLICTGEFEAIDLKVLHSREIILIDRKAEQYCNDPENKGHAKFMLQLKRKVFELVEACETFIVRPVKSKQPTII